MELSAEIRKGTDLIYQKVFITLIHHTGLQIKHKV